MLANEPNAPLPVSLNRHFGFRLATFVESMRLAVVARVFARSRLKAGHCWENAAASGGSAPADGRGRGAGCRQTHGREAGGEQDGEVETRHDAPS